jgi:AcrR family transcriptional regulator
MGKVTQRLTREDWILAGFRALTKGGLGAVRIEAVARDLATTKGSFYWHFKDLGDWRSAMLVYWEEEAFGQIVAGLETVPRGLARLQALTDIAATRGRDPAHGGVLAESALRDWARYEPEVAVAVRRVDAGRIRFVADCLGDAAGRDMEPQARLFYAAHLGLQALQGSAAEDARALHDLLAAMLRGDASEKAPQT